MKLGNNCLVIKSILGLVAWTVVQGIRVMKNVDSKKTKLKWDKLDNTALLFPVIANESMSSVYRISLTLSEEIEKDLLQEALNRVLPFFDIFNSRMRNGLFWYYFETNPKEPPIVMEEDTYPCIYIPQYGNRDYLFRVTYYKKRINLEVFHVLTDGMGGITFLRELVYQYLRLKYPELQEKMGDGLCSDTSLNKEDSYLKNYYKSCKKQYKTEKSFHLKGEIFATPGLGVMHGYMPVEDIKRVAKSHDMSINQYLVGVMTYAIYMEAMHGKPHKRPIATCVPVNLRPYFGSNTTKNFFAVVTAVFHANKENMTFEEVLAIVKESLKQQITKENLEKVIAYNVSNEKVFVLRLIPLFIKNLAIKFVYQGTANANTTTVTNLGEIKILDEYVPYIKQMHIVLSNTQGQNLKSAINTYQGVMTFSISSKLTDTSIQKAFFRKLAEEGISLSVETNGVYYE